MFDLTIGTLTFGGREEPKRDPPSLVTRFWYGGLPYNCKPARPKNLSGGGGHPAGAYDRKRQEVAVVVHFSFVFSLCKSICHVLNAILLKYFMIELQCFKRNLLVTKKYRVTESYRFLVTLVESAVGYNRWG